MIIIIGLILLFLLVWFVIIPGIAGIVVWWKPSENGTRKSFAKGWREGRAKAKADIAARKAAKAEAKAIKQLRKELDS